jgi:hypothetical protein
MTRWVVAFLGAITLLVVAVVFSPEAEGIVLNGYFVDDDGSTFEADIDAIAHEGITRGCNPPTNNRFCPDDRVTRGQMAALLRRALQLPASSDDHFVDISGNTFEADINAIAEVGITRGCNPPTNNRFCPDDFVTREQMAAFLVRGFELTANTHAGFVDVAASNTFFHDIGALATADITRGCNPPSNDRYCPRDHVTRGQMAAFLRRALELPAYIQQIPMGHHSSMSCSKDGERCSLTVDLSSGRPYRVQEGLFLVNPASSAEQSQFNSSSTTFALTLNGSSLSLNGLSPQTSGGITTRNWRRDIAFTPGTHTLVGRWRWNGALVQTSIITVRASG